MSFLPHTTVSHDDDHVRCAFIGVCSETLRETRLCFVAASLVSKMFFPLSHARRRRGTRRKRGLTSWRDLAIVSIAVSFVWTANSSSQCQGKTCRHRQGPKEDNVFVTPTVSPSPSRSPAPTSTSSPTHFVCTVDETGIFGSGAGIATIVDYYYQVETMAGVTESKVNDEIAPATERSIASTILPTLFPDECESRALTRRLQKRRLQTLGFASRPPDRVLSGIPCQVEQVDANNNCFLVDGAFTLVTDTLNLDPGLEGSIQQLLESTIDSGAFDEVDDRVVKISYIPEADVIGINPISGGEEEDKQAQADGSLPSYVWVIIAVGVAGTSVMLYLVASSRWKHRQDETTVSGEGSFDGGTVQWQPLAVSQDEYNDEVASLQIADTPHESDMYISSHSEYDDEDTDDDDHTAPTSNQLV